jgi:hypothetical protein
VAEHAKFSPSHARTWAGCMGALELSRDFPDKTSAAALEGTMAHAVLEQCLLWGATPQQVLDRGWSAYPIEDYDLDQMVEGVQLALDTVYTEAKLHGAKIMIEEKVRITEDCWGTADIILWAEHLGWMGVYDFKYGAGIFVGAVDNWQLELYGIGAVKLLKPSALTCVELGIIQPRIPSDLGRVRTSIYTLDELFEREDFFVGAMKHQGPSYSPSDAACQWCRAKPVCAALKEKCLADAAIWFAPEELTRESIEARCVNIPAELTMEDRVAILANVELIRGWLKSVEGHSLEIALAGTVIPGFKVVRGAGGQRKWNAEQDVLYKMFSGMKVRKTDVTKSVLLGPAPIEKLGKKLMKQKTLSKRQFDRIMGHVVKPPGKATLVSEADERPAVALTAEQMFD